VGHRGAAAIIIVLSRRARRVCVGSEATLVLFEKKAAATLGPLFGGKDYVFTAQAGTVQRGKLTNT
jgi:hypothetical protein